MRNLPTSDDDKYHSFVNKVRLLYIFSVFFSINKNQLSAASAALDLALLSQTSPRSSFPNRAPDSREKSSEWPQFNAAPRPDGLLSRNDRRSATNPNLTFTPPGATVSTSSTPLLQHHPQIVAHAPPSPRGSPLENSARSVPATPLSIAGNVLRAKTPGTPHSPDHQVISARLTPQISTPRNSNDNAVNAGDLQASLSRIPSGQYENNGSLTFNSLEDDSVQASSSLFFSS